MCKMHLATELPSSINNILDLRGLGNLKSTLLGMKAIVHAHGKVMGL